MAPPRTRIVERKDGRPSYWTYIESKITHEPIFKVNPLLSDQLYDICQLSLQQLYSENVSNPTICTNANCPHCNWILQYNHCEVCQEALLVISSSSSSKAASAAIEAATSLNGNSKVATANDLVSIRRGKGQTRREKVAAASAALAATRAKSSPTNRICFPMFIPVAHDSGLVHIKSVSLCSDTCCDTISQLGIEVIAKTAAGSAAGAGAAIEDKNRKNNHDSKTIKSKIINNMKKNNNKSNTNNTNSNSTNTSTIGSYLELLFHSIMAIFYTWILRYKLQSGLLGSHLLLDIITWIMIAKFITSWIVFFRDISVLLEVSDDTIRLFSRLSIRWNIVTNPIQIIISTIYIFIHYNGSESSYQLLLPPMELLEPVDLTTESYLTLLHSLPLPPLFIYGIIPCIGSILEMIASAISRYYMLHIDGLISYIKIEPYVLITQTVLSQTILIIYLFFVSIMYCITGTIPYPNLFIVNGILDVIIIAISTLSFSTILFIGYYLLQMFITAFYVKWYKDTLIKQD